MPGRYRQSQNNSRSRFYILLSIVFVVVMYKWGVPAFMNIIAGSGGQKVNTNVDIIPPQSPVISALPEATNSARLYIEGFTEAGANVELILNDQTDKMIKANDTGAFSFDSTLIVGENKIQLRAKDATGNESMSEISKVTYDNKPVELTVTSPKDGTEYFGKLNQVVEIKGEVNKSGCEVTINNSFVQVDRSGAFLHRYSLSGGDNVIKISVVDKAGNTDEKTIKLVYTP